MPIAGVAPKCCENETTHPKISPINHISRLEAKLHRKSKKQSSGIGESDSPLDSSCSGEMSSQSDKPPPPPPDLLLGVKESTKKRKLKANKTKVNMVEISNDIGLAVRKSNDHYSPKNATTATGHNLLPNSGGNSNNNVFTHIRTMNLPKTDSTSSSSPPSNSASQRSRFGSRSQDKKFPSKNTSSRRSQATRSEHRASGRDAVKRGSGRVKPMSKSMGRVSERFGDMRDNGRTNKSNDSTSPKFRHSKSSPSGNPSDRGPESSALSVFRMSGEYDNPMTLSELPLDNQEFWEKLLAEYAILDSPFKPSVGRKASLNSLEGEDRCREIMNELQHCFNNLASNSPVATVSHELEATTNQISKSSNKVSPPSVSPSRGAKPATIKSSLYPFKSSTNAQSKPKPATKPRQLTKASVANGRLPSKTPQPGSSSNSTQSTSSGSEPDGSGSPCYSSASTKKVSTISDDTSSANSEPDQNGDIPTTIKPNSKSDLCSAPGFVKGTCKVAPGVLNKNAAGWTHSLCKCARVLSAELKATDMGICEDCCGIIDDGTAKRAASERSVKKKKTPCYSQDDYLEIPRLSKHSKMAQCDCLERPLSVFFYKYGRFVARNPIPFIVFPIILTIGFSVGFLYRNTVLDATYLYTPRDAPSRYEREVIHQHWPLLDGHYQPSRAVTEIRQCQITVVSADGGNILRPRFGQAVEDLNDFILKDIVVTHDNRRYNYTNLCLRDYNQECFYNPYVALVNTMYVHYPNNLTFPAIYLGLRKLYIASTLGGVRIKNNTTVVHSAQAWMLIYHLRFHPHNTSVISAKWEKAFEEAMRNFNSKYLKITYFHSQTLSDELHRNADQLVPKFTVTFCVLVTFAVLCAITIVPGTMVVDWVVSKTSLAFLGVVNAGMGVISAIGALSFTGIDYNDIVAVMPFLVISIGVDNMFLMIAAWRRTNRALSVEKRLAESLSDSAISITITAFTDALSFGIGAITPIPAVKIFCAYTSVAIVVTFIYQLTFFVGLIVVFGRLEQKGRNNASFMVANNPASSKKPSLLGRLFNMGTKADLDPKNLAKNFDDPLVNRFFRDWFAPVIMNPVIKVLVIIWLILYLSVAIWGCTQLREGLKPVNLLVADSYAIPHYESLEKHFWPYGVQVQIVVNNAPDLSTLQGRNEAMDIVETFANTEHTVGMEGVEFFLTTYMKYLETFEYMDGINKDPSLFFTILRDDFLTLNSYAIWRDDIKFAGPRGHRASFNTFGVGGVGPPLNASNPSGGPAGLVSPAQIIDQERPRIGRARRQIIARANPTSVVPKFTLDRALSPHVVRPLNRDRVTSFRFTVGMKNFQSTNQQRETMQLLRETAQLFPDRNVTTFMVIWLFGDQYSVILPNTLQNIAIALACMVVISLVLIPQPMCALWVALCIASIDTGVIGYMTLWGVNLDAISMITIIMSIGFSVDFSAHISYGYVISDQDDPGRRVCQALGALGWPILQGALSTIFGVAVLATVDAYMIVTFFKTVFLVILLGAIHGLVFLPVLLSIFVRDTCFTLSSRKEKLKAEQSLQIAVQETQEPEEMMHTFGPFGRYGIYLPRLSHNSEYFPGKGEVFSWARPPHYPVPPGMNGLGPQVPNPTTSVHFGPIFHPASHLGGSAPGASSSTAALLSNPSQFSLASMGTPNRVNSLVPASVPYVPSSNDGGRGAQNSPASTLDLAPFSVSEDTNYYSQTDQSESSNPNNRNVPPIPRRGRDPSSNMQINSAGQSSQSTSGRTPSNEPSLSVKPHKWSSGSSESPAKSSVGVPELRNRKVYPSSAATSHRYPDASPGPATGFHTVSMSTGRNRAGIQTDHDRTESPRRDLSRLTSKSAEDILGDVQADGSSYQGTPSKSKPRTRQVPGDANSARLPPSYKDSNKRAKSAGRSGATSVLSDSQRRAKPVKNLKKHAVDASNAAYANPSLDMKMDDAASAYSNRR